MSNLWIYKYQNDTIVVKSADSSQLLVNDVVQDTQYGVSLTRDLSGKLETGEEIKVSLIGLFPPKCQLFVDNILLEPSANIEL